MRDVLHFERDKTRYALALFGVEWHQEGGQREQRPPPLVLEEDFERNSYSEPYYQCAGVVTKKKAQKAKTAMAKRSSAETECDFGPTGEKRPRTGHTSGEQAAYTAPPCHLCALWRQPTNPPGTRHSSRVRPRGLRIALVDEDPRMDLVARQMVQAQGDGWTLEVYHPCCPVRGTAGPKGSFRPNPVQGHHRASRPPDIVLISLSGHEDARLACVRKLKALAPLLPVLIVSRDRDEALVAECCAAGGDGYILKPLSPEQLARAVSSVAQGSPVLCVEAQKAILNVLHRSATATTVWFPGLTGSEQDIAGCLVAHLSDKEISTHLGMAKNTVHVHLTRLYGKLGVHSRRQAVAKLLGVGEEASSPF
jgi:DNA-binding NarL/FixJ family response regulator